MFHLSRQKHINFKTLHERADQLIARLPAVKKKRKLNAVLTALKYFFAAFSFLFLVFLILLSIRLLSLKAIYDQAALGKFNLEQSIIFAKQEDFSRAETLAKSSEANFDNALSGLEKLKANFLILGLPPLINSLTDAQRLAISGKFLSKAVGGGAAFGQNLEALLQGDKKLNFSKFSPEEKRGLLKEIYEAAPELNGIKADLDLAYYYLEQAGSSRFLSFFKNEIDSARDKINQARLIMNQAIPLSQLLPALAGYPQNAVYLVLLQNNDELRPTGGFLGTYGILKTKDGEITDFNTDDIYHLDMPIQDQLNIAPPPPIKRYLVDKWYMRDGNWSPDWPAAARQLDWFYQVESDLSPDAEKIKKLDGVIAITPKLIMDLLDITGAVVVEGQTYTSHNFQDLLQYRVEKGYQLLGVSAWQRKEVIGEISKELKIKIFDLPAKRWAEIIRTVTDNLSEKNILLYLTDSQAENLVINNGWGGEIKNYFSDYLMAVDANLGALKTDAVMNRRMDYKLKETDSGLLSELTLGYSHNGQSDWKTSKYKSYTRIYVPRGSQLIDISDYNSPEIEIGQESGKTYFGFYLEVEPGKIKNITVLYKLPPSVKAGGLYGLYIQKQPGKELSRLSVDLRLKNEIKSYNPSSLSTRKIGQNGLFWEGDLRIDRNFEISY
ncbi:MAG: DUF4012 domain-containing protein [bacterium]|nr:DUF4012 domain-containing protein [bacterium]